jgi:DNA-binding response OmpR family regulator
MSKNVLIVDDDQELLLVLKEGLEKYSDIFQVLLAGDGQAGVRKLERNPVSLVVADLKMPRMDGFSLLAYISEHYPDIPVMIITAYGTPRMQKLAQEGGAVGYLEKPFMIEDLAEQIMSILRKQSEGGTLRGISPGMFLQLIEMEQKTCTLRVSERSTEKQGVLFFRDGELLDARTGNLQGEQAAFEILSWDDVGISIQNSCPMRERKIRRDPQAVLMEAMRRKDETSESGESEEFDQREAREIRNELTDRESEQESQRLETLRKRLDETLGEKGAIEDLYQDSSRDEMITYLSRLGEMFHAGPLKVGYFDKGEPTGYFIVPGGQSAVIEVGSRCPREKMIEVLSS